MMVMDEAGSVSNDMWEALLAKSRKLPPLTIRVTRDSVEARGPVREVLALLALLTPYQRATYAQQHGSGVACWPRGEVRP